MRRYNSGLSEGQVVCEEPLSYADNLLSGLFGPETYIVLGMALLLFLLVPALNLSGMNASRIQERVGELGIRKAFGATKATLMGQVFVENMVLMLPGGVAGLLFSYVLVFIFRNALLVPGFNLLGTSGDVFLSPGDAAQYVGLRVRLGVCVALNLLSSMLPAWRIVRGEYNGCVEWINRRYGYDNTYIETDKVPHGGQRMDTGRVAGGVRGDLVHDQLLLDDG